METGVIAGTVLLGGMVFGLTGYGFVVTVAPILIHLMSPAEVVLMGHLLGSIQIIALLVPLHRFVDPKASLSMVGAAVAGLPIGLVALRTASAAQMKLLIGSLTIGAALFLLFGFSVRIRRQALGLALAGFFGGVLSTSTGLAGIPPGLFLLNQRWGRHEMRANVATFLLAVTVLTLAALLASRTVSGGQLVFSLRFAPSALLGIIVGHFLANHVSERLFRIAVLVVIGAAGISSVIAALAARP